MQRVLLHRSMVFAVMFCTIAWLSANSARAQTDTGFARVMPSIVSVLPEWANAKSRTKEPEGSGIVILDGSIIITARHVITKALSIRVRTHDGRVLTAEVIGYDRLTDLALLSITEKLPAISFGRAAQLGEPACTIGNAFGLGLSITCGIISATHKAGISFNPIEDFIQTDAAVNPGASGGALVARDGTLLGILSAIFTKESDANIGVNFAVSAMLAKRVAKGLSRNKKIHWQFSGLKFKSAVSAGDTGTLAAEIINVRTQTPGEKAGLKVGDKIVQLADRRIRKPADFRSAFVSQAPGTNLAIKLIRKNVEMNLQIQVPQ